MSQIRQYIESNLNIYRKESWTFLDGLESTPQVYYNLMGIVSRSRPRLPNELKL